MYNNVLEISENARNFISELNLSCSLAMDDGGRCLLDVINDPLLLQSFLESGSDDNSKDPQDGTSSESAVESPQISRHTQVAIPNHNSENVIEPSPEQMGYSYPIDGTGLLAHSAACSISTGLGVGMSLVVASSPAGPPTYHTASPSGATIHHIPSPASQVSLHQPSPASAPRSVTPLSHAIKSPSQGPSSVHSMPPPSPLQQTRSPLPPHTPSPAPAWSPAPPVQSPVGSRSQSAMPSIAFQQSHNQLLQTSSNMAQFVQALTSQQSITQKLSLQQQQLLLHQPLPPSSQQQQATRLSTVASPVVPTTTTAVAVSPSVVQIIPAPQSNVPLPVRTSQSSVRPIQPKLPQQILPKPTGATTNQFVTPVVKQAGATPVTAGQRGVGVGLQPGTAGQLVIGQGQPGVFAGPQGTIVLNQIIPAAMGQSPILIQGNIGNLQGVQLTLRPPANASSGQTVTAAGTQNNATLIAALQGPTQPAQALFTQTKPPIHGQQTIVIPNNIAHTGLAPQNLNLATTGIPNSAMVPSASQGQGFLARSNIILAPRVMGPNHGLQLQHIQTPQGSILALAPSQAIALPQLQTALQNTALGGPQLAPGTVPMHSVVATGQGVISGLSLQSHQAHTALQQHHQQQQHSLFTGSAVPFTSHLDQSPHQQQMVQVAPALPPQPVATSIASSHSVVQQQHHHHHHHLQQDEPSPKPATPPKPSKVPSVNLEELLKEHGIVPENTPPPSPDSQSPQSEEPVPSQLTTASSISQSPQLIAALQPQHPVVAVEQLSHNHPTPSLPQLKLALAQDGSVILQPHTAITSVQQPISEETEVPASNVSSVVLSTVTTSAVSVPVVTTQPCTTHGHSALLARLNAAPAVSVPDVVTSLALATGLGSCTTSSITTTTITTTTTTLIPLTVQSLSTRSIPITSSQVAQSVSSVSSSVPNQTSSETNLSVAQTRSNAVMIDTPSSSPAPNIQNRINPVIFGFQPLVPPSHQHTSSTVQAVSQVVSTSLPGSVSTGSSQSGVSVVQQTRPAKVSQPETQVVGVADNNNGAIAPSHKVQTIPLGVPNQQMLHHKIHKQISELLAQKSLTPQQQQVLKHLLNNHSLQQNVIVQAKLSHGQASRISQPHLENEQEKDKPLPQPSLSNQANVITTQHQPLHQQQSQQQDQQQTIKSVTGHNVHLVNLLKQGPVHNTSLRLLAPAATSSASTVCDSTTAITSLAVPSHVRVGNQILAVTQQRHPVHHQLRSLPQEQLQANQPQQTLVLRVQSGHQQQQQSSSVTLPSVIQIQGKPPVNRIVAPVSKAALLHQQLTMDQNGAVNSDTKNPFSSKDDACRRLLNYHVFNSKVPSVDEIQKADQTFDMVSKQLLDKYRKMMNKYQYLLIKESMRPCPTPERVMLERMFIHEESQSLKADKAAVEDGKTLDLPPPPECWLKDLNPSPDHQSREDNYHLDAPIIDSCAEAMSPKCDDDENFERSPPTLKRISIKSERFSEKDFEEPVCKKPAKLLNCNIIKSEPSVIEWCNENSLCHSPSSKLCEAELDSININKNIHARSDENFHADNREEDIMTKIRKELNISPLENDDEADVPHVDFEPPSETNGLADFEPPIARTEESCDSTLLTTYSTNGTRTNSELKYDFDMLDSTSEWVEVYSNHADKPVTESEAAVESILSDQHNQSDLDLSGIEGLDDNLEESQVIIPNGIQDDGEGSRESELNYIGFDIPKARGCREEESLRVRGDEQNDELHAQVQSAIKSILELQSEHRSYYSDGEAELIPRIYGLEKESEDLNKQGRDTPVVDYDVSLDADMGVTSSESDAALDEAVRSILL